MPEKWGIAHIFSSMNNTIVHITDITGSETIAMVSGGSVSDKDMNKGKPFTAMKVAIPMSHAVPDFHSRGAIIPLVAA